MKSTFISSLTIAAALVASAIAQPPAMPAPAKEHEWLEKFAGEWTVETKIHMEPGKPPVETKGTESARMVGKFWVVGETKSDFMGQPFTGIMTFGYDPEKKKYIGSWIDSMTGKLWSYAGNVDVSGKVLTLECEGSCPMDGKHYKMRDTIEWKSENQRVMTSARLMDGQWVTGMTATATRKQP